MSFSPHWMPGASADYKKLKADALASLHARKINKNKKATGAEGLFKQVKKCIDRLLANPRHPGLSTHKYQSLTHPWDAKKDVFEAYVQNHTPGAYRLFWCYGPNKGQITILAITPHP